MHGAVQPLHHADMVKLKLELWQASTHNLSSQVQPATASPPDPMHSLSPAAHSSDNTDYCLAWQWPCCECASMQGTWGTFFSMSIAKALAA
jgi:hypothetical protein